MSQNLKLEKVWINQEYWSGSYDKTGHKRYFSHTVQLEAIARNEEPNQNSEISNQNFVSKFASQSILRIFDNNEILGLVADSLEIIPGDCSLTNETDLDKVFFKVTNNSRDNQLDFVYYLDPWQKCSIRFSFLCQKRIDISTIDKMNVQEWIR